jgi:hypothetical protein
MDTTGKKTIYAVKPAFPGMHKIVADADGHHQPTFTNLWRFFWVCAFAVYVIS